MRDFCERLSNFVCVLLSLFGIEGGMWDVFVLIPDHCLAVYFFFIIVLNKEKSQDDPNTFNV